MNEQDIYEELLIDKIDFSDDEDAQDDAHKALKKASRYQMAEEPGIAGGKADINLAGYFHFFLRKEHAPDIGKYSKKWEKQGLYNSTAIRIADSIKMTGKGIVH